MRQRTTAEASLAAGGTRAGRSSTPQAALMLSPWRYWFWVRLVSAGWFVELVGPVILHQAMPRTCASPRSFPAQGGPTAQTIGQEDLLRLVRHILEDAEIRSNRAAHRRGPRSTARGTLSQRISQVPARSRREVSHKNSDTPICDAINSRDARDCRGHHNARRYRHIPCRSSHQLPRMREVGRLYDSATIAPSEWISRSFHHSPANSRILDLGRRSTGDETDSGWAACRQPKSRIRTR